MGFGEVRHAQTVNNRCVTEAAPLISLCLNFLWLLSSISESSNAVFVTLQSFHGLLASFPFLIITSCFASNSHQTAFSWLAGTNSFLTHACLARDANGYQTTQIAIPRHMGIPWETGDMCCRSHCRQPGLKQHVIFWFETCKGKQLMRLSGKLVQAFFCSQERSNGAWTDGALLAAVARKLRNLRDASSSSTGLLQHLSGTC